MTWAGARSCVPGFHGQFDGEAGAMAGPAIDADASVVGLDELADDGKAEADPRGFATEFTAAAHEGFEDPGVIGGRDARALILNLQDGETGNGR